MPTDKNPAIINANDQVRSGVLEQINDLQPSLQTLKNRPDVTAILADLEAIKNLKGGPADATAFHDFHVLQMAFKHVWMQAVDITLQDKAEQLYEETVKLYNNAGVEAPAFDAINDITQLKDFLRTVQGIFLKAPSVDQNQSKGYTLPTYSIGPKVSVTVAPPIATRIPEIVINEYPEAQLFWHDLDSIQQNAVIEQANIIKDPNSSSEKKKEAKNKITIIAQSALGKSGRIFNLIFELGRAISEPYAFDIFAPDSYNYGIMLTYRQKWEPLEYQAGELVATIPLAPGEIRKYSKRHVVKKTRAEKEIEKSMSSRSLQTSEISRAESEIMNKTTTATNFKMTSSGSFNIGIASVSSSSEFAQNQAQESASNKKEFHEATLKAAEEYRLERSLEIDTTTTTELEETSSGEISNPNNEITVTYLFYELQRRYKISESIYRARPVILVAQDVPAPHEIDEAWLLQYQWIISRVLLDDSFRSALDYLTSGMAGDEVSISIVKAHWLAQENLAQSLEAQVESQLTIRNRLRDELIESEFKAKMLPEKFFTFTFDPSKDESPDLIEARRKAAETRLKYVEGALEDAQSKLKQASDSYEKATKEYATALQNQYSRHIAIDQLRVHVKQNILYYMQAIWAHEPPDQRFFRLYKLRVACTKPAADCSPKHIIPKETSVLSKIAAVGSIPVNLTNSTIPLTVRACIPVPSTEVDLVEMADLDNPLGFKGNYIIFPLKQHCYLTDYMLHEFVDDYFGVRDPDEFGNYSIEELGNLVNEKITNVNTTEEEGKKLKEIFVKYLTMARRTTDEIIVPTGQLFIEALPGFHPLLEDFKLVHRAEDVRKVKAEVRHAELENLRLASRLVNGEENAALLEDPDIEKKIVVDRNASVSVDTN